MLQKTMTFKTSLCTWYLYRTTAKTIDKMTTIKAAGIVEAKTTIKVSF